MQALQIIQYNTHRSKDKVMATFLRDKKVLEAAVIAVQEPWNNSLNETTHQPAKTTHQLLYPKTTGSDNPERPRVALYVAKSIDPSQWTHTAVSRDHQILRIQYKRGDAAHSLCIHNIYNEPRSTTFNQLDSELAKHPEAEHIVLGDMNVHHPTWGGPGTPIESEAEHLLEIMDQHRIELTTKEGLVTWERGNNTPRLTLPSYLLHLPTA
jgi:Endonuclease-reverse transcriptase